MPNKSHAQKHNFGLLAALWLFAMILFFALGGDPIRDAKLALERRASLKAIGAFVRQDARYGQIISMERINDWVRGPSWRVKTSTGKTIICCMSNHEVEEAWIKEKALQTLIYQKGPNRISVMGTRQKTIVVEYTIIEKMERLEGDFVGVILVPSLSMSTPEDLRFRIAKAICAQEHFPQADFYCTQEAYEADISEFYRDSHPGALEKGSLGYIDSEGVFWVRRGQAMAKYAGN